MMPTFTISLYHCNDSTFWGYTLQAQPSIAKTKSDGIRFRRSSLRRRHSLYITSSGSNEQTNKSNRRRRKRIWTKPEQKEMRVPSHLEPEYQMSHSLMLKKYKKKILFNMPFFKTNQLKYFDRICLQSPNLNQAFNFAILMGFMEEK